MAFIKKKWVNVPDPSNPPSIPEGQDALARFDADNMNRIEDGIAKATEDLLKKAPSGHGLGGNSASHTGISFLDLLQEGSGFYTIGEASDTPYKNGEWLGALQVVRQTQTGAETGLQLAFYDFSPRNPNIWIRTSLKGEAGIWHELLHTGNISNYANAKITKGTYTGTGSGERSISTGGIGNLLMVLSDDGTFFATPNGALYIYRSDLNTNVRWFNYIYYENGILRYRSTRVDAEGNYEADQTTTPIINGVGVTYTYCCI